MSVRNVVWGLGTVSVVVLMLSYTTSKPPSSHAAAHADEGTVVQDPGAAGGAVPGDGTDAAPGGSATVPATQTVNPGQGASGGTAPGTSTGTTSGTRPPTGSTSTAPAQSPTRTTSARKSVTGAVYQAGQWGPFQVRATFSGTRIVSVSVLQHPTGGRSDDINAEAIPQLNAAAVRTQGASGIDSVSGATYSSVAYKQSLQSAIDRSRS